MTPNKLLITEWWKWKRERQRFQWCCSDDGVKGGDGLLSTFDGVTRDPVGLIDYIFLSPVRMALGNLLLSRLLSSVYSLLIWAEAPSSLNGATSSEPRRQVRSVTEVNPTGNWNLHNKFWIAGKNQDQHRHYIEPFSTYLTTNNNAREALLLYLLAARSHLASQRSQMPINIKRIFSFCHSLFFLSFGARLSF